MSGATAFLSLLFFHLCANWPREGRPRAPMPLFKRSPAKAATAPPAPAPGPPSSSSGGDGSGGAASGGGSGGPPVDVSPSALAFSSSPKSAGQEQARTFTIANRSPTHAVAFKVKCSNRDAYVVDVASGVLAPLAARRVRVFRLASGGGGGGGGCGRGPPSSSPPAPDAFCVTALALPADTPLAEAAAAALTGRMGAGAADVLLPVTLADGAVEGGPPPEGVALAGVVGAAAGAGVASPDVLPRLLHAFATYLASKGLVDDLAGALAAGDEVGRAVPWVERGQAAAPGPGPAAGPVATPPTPTPAEQGGSGGGGGAGGGVGSAAGTPPTSTAVPAFAARRALFERAGEAG